MTCIESINQPIYQALLEKAASYPADKPFQAAAYKKAAEAVRTWNYDLYKDFVYAVPGVNRGIGKFLEDFIQKSKSAQMNDIVPPTRSVQMRSDTKGSGPFGYLADADETEEDDARTTLIPTSRKITVQMLIDSLQAAIKKNPAVATMEVVPDILNDGNNLGPYELTIDSNVVFISSGERNPY